MNGKTKSLDTRIWCIIPAAGKSERFGTTNKLYIKVKNNFLIENSIKPFIRLSQIYRIIIPLNKLDKKWKKTKYYNSNKVVTLIGSTSRQKSVYKSLCKIKELGAKNSDWVIIHDAARPFFNQKDLKRFISITLKSNWGAVIGLPASDTIKLVEKNKIISTIERNSVWLAHTPQMFRIKDLLKGYEFCKKNKLLVTDDSQVIESIGIKPLIIESSCKNIKVTNKIDIR